LRQQQRGLGRSQLTAGGDSTTVGGGGEIQDVG
jgi:hypothetical protein